MEPMADNGDSGKQETWRLLNEEFTKRLDVQRQSGSSVDTKTAAVVAASVAFAQFVVGRSDLHVAWKIAALGLFSVSGVLGYFAILPAKFKESEPRFLYRLFRTMPFTRALPYLIAVKVKAFECNRETYKRKATLHLISLACFLLAALAVAIARMIGE
jgi:hypothetical protein